MTQSKLTLAILLALSASVAHAQGQAQTTVGSEPAGTGATQLDTVVVTGTRVTDRTVAESLAPIDIISPEMLQATATSDLATALARALPSLNYPRTAVGTEGTDAIRPAQLRGLSADQVLVLVNGKRRHAAAQLNISGVQGRGTSPVDLNAIPIAAVERIEVLRDGASAQYGSDAIAGVINIVLKGGSDHGSLEARYGQYSAGDGAHAQLSGDGGIALGDAGSLHFAAQLSQNDNTDRARPFIGTVTPTSAPAGRVVQSFGEPDVDFAAVSFNGDFAVSEAVTLYGFGTATNRNVLTNGFFRPGGDPRNVPEIFPDGYLPLGLNLSQDRAIVAGLRGDTASGWRWDISYNYGYNQLSFDFRNNLNRSLGTASPTSFFAGEQKRTQNLLNADVSRAFDVGLAYPLTVSFGAEYREEEFDQVAGEPASYVNGGVVSPDGVTYVGTQLFAGYSPQDAGTNKRDSYAVYVDLEASLTDKFSAGIAGRFEDYSDFGTTTSGKLSARYAFTDAVALRGTVSSGFRAPSLPQQFYSSTAVNFIGGQPFQVRTFPVADPVAVALGAEPLRAEESLNYSIGLVLQPLDALYITVDAYQIDVDDRITLSENLTGPDVVAFLAALGLPGVTGGRYFTNAVDTRTQGVDIVGSYNWKLARGSFDLTFGYNYTDTEVTRIAPNPAALEQGGLNLLRIGRVELGRLTLGYPKDKLNLGGLLNLGNWEFNLNATRYGEYSVLVGQAPATPNRDQTFGSKWVLDLKTTYRFDNWAFSLGADNVLNEHPDEVLFANSNGGQFPYNSTSPFGFSGAFVYASARVSW
ncbi:MAG TPA: TonB-dependent receptor [Rhodocyclaceae bacterium]|nr:TonB-dependent receptor [Rhodocyclaceae bacterium]